MIKVNRESNCLQIKLNLNDDENLKFKSSCYYKGQHSFTVIAAVIYSDD